MGHLDRADALDLIGKALADCQESLGLPEIHLTDASPPRIEYVGPLGRARPIKLDLADDELVEETERRPVFLRYSDQVARDCLAYTLEETAAEKLRCVIQRLQCRDLFDLHELFVVRELDPEFVWPLFERKTRHRDLDPDLFPERLKQREAEYRVRWTNELADHVSGDPPQFNRVIRTVRRELRDFLRVL
jgi:predicted nucleotidyltransferase component of viral defense system